MKLILGECLDKMSDIKNNSVNTWITSPPYAKQRAYNGAKSEDYISFISPIMEEAKRTMTTNGSIFLNIKEHCFKGSRDLYVFKMIIHFVEKLGFNFVDEFIWVKTNPFPTGSKNRLKDGYERILHFTKSKKYKFSPNEVLIKSESKWLESEKRRANKGSHNVNNGSGMNIGHPAVYPTYIPEFFIKLTTNKNDIVGDMFMGSGSTGVACKNLDRSFIGIEMDDKYFEIAKGRIFTR